MIDLEELKRKYAAATPGEWQPYIKAAVIDIHVKKFEVPHGDEPTIVHWIGFDSSDQEHKKT